MRDLIHNLAYDASCEMERTELLRFAKTFVCKTTGASVDASAVESAAVVTPAALAGMRAAARPACHSRRRS